MRSAVISQYSYFAQASLNKIENILDYKEMHYGNKSGNDISLEFKNVSFAYEDNTVVDDISIKVKKGETVALVGPSGGGKTTIAKLAARFYDPQSGEIFVGGINIKEYDKQTLMNKISFVFQNSRLFKMSLRVNLLI
ncbi:ABC transporter ATP-binding protein, partial [Escherichia coli]|uniref:ATP-binding cassette domain-containing protein n=1 Tax=Escherichia coli TaxID=562 RepID=UPI001A8C4F47